jgi:hypothetical protein
LKSEPGTSPEPYLHLALPGGGNSRLDALPAGGGDSVAVEDGPGPGVQVTVPGKPPGSLPYSVAAGAPAAAASAIAGPAAFPLCALPAAGGFRPASFRPTAFRGAAADFDFLAALVRAARFRPGLAAAGVVSPARTIRTRPSGIGRRFLRGRAQAPASPLVSGQPPGVSAARRSVRCA